ncbi:zinc ribbon domain-containing protein [Caballeronia sp. LZ062]|uniref:zinc ribbon domain-containing protein n=1 Tax=unclassified Caballeronia TaxID=2646786 RepID=UPI002858502C|nr:MULTISPECIES: zinc ribbon domain-containing protein [unclassified Caballeronia]MDR5857589.1 zinc ribbon domain-containing protein [Caballeronia sp. LZ050]MDR5869139.1 zinc ribbon domain-containing protein [Caballeronia sp. LZ062]
MFEQQMSNPPFVPASASTSTPVDDGEPGLRDDWSGGWDPKRASERIAQKAAEHRAKRVEQSARNAYADPSNDPDALPGSDKWGGKKTLIAGACALALVAGGVAYMRYGADDRAPATDLSASGSIDAKFGPFGRGATDASGSTDATDATSSADQSAQQTPSAPKASALTLAPGDALHGMRAALDQHDLTLARARMKALPANQQARPEFDALKDELVKRELQRDAALQLARACERTSAWACVQQNAAEALALDGGNGESQAMLERVITHAGWLVATPQGAKKAAPAVNATDDTNSGTAAAGSVTPAPAPVANAPAAAPAQANVASAPQAEKTDALAAKPAPDKRSAQRNANAAAAAAAAAAARQAALDDARAAGEYTSRAEKLARAQAATNAMVAATILQPPPGTTTAAKPATPTAPESVAAAPSAPKPATAAPTHAAESNNGMYVATSPPNSNGMYVAPSSAQSDMYVAPAAPNGMYVAPAARTAPAPTQAPSPAPAAAPAQRATPAGAQSFVPPVLPQTASVQPQGAHTLPTGLQSVRPASIERPAVATTTAVTTAPSPLPTAPISGAARPATAFAASNVTARMDADKTDDVERAIKQYGWSSGNQTPAPAR